MASIEKRSKNSYRITVSCGYLPNGKKDRRYKTITLPDNLTERQKEKELQRQAVNFEQQVENGTFLDAEKITFEEFIKKWVTDYAEKQLAPATLIVYKTRIEKRIIPALGHIKLAKLQPHHLLEFYNNLAEGGIRLDVLYKPTKFLMSILNSNNKVDINLLGISRHTFNKIKCGNQTNEETAQKVCNHFQLDIGKAFQVANRSEKLSNTTISHHHKLISSILTTAVQWQIISNSPTQRIKPPEAKKQKTQSYDDEQVLKMFAALEQAPINYRTMIYLVIYSGIRLSELAGVKWENVNQENRTVTIDSQRMYIAKYGTFERETKTESGERCISLPPVVMKLLSEYRSHCTKLWLQMGNLWEGAPPGTSYIFLGDRGKPMFPLRPSKWFNEFLKRHELPKIVFHGLRHSHASLLIAEGVDIATVSERLGHANKTITLNTYSHAFRSRDRTAAEKLEKLFTAPKQKKVLRRRFRQNSPQIVPK